MSTETYFRVKIMDIPTSAEDLITGHSFEFGATGVTEALAFSQPDLTYDPDLIHSKTHTIEVFFPKAPAQDYFDKILEWAPRARWEISEETHKDWLAEWKKGFVPFQLVGPFWVVPSWHEAPAEAKRPLYIDPGMAFGTGTHATTQMAAYFVHKVCSSLIHPENNSLIDVGTGTGILAMLAAELRVGRCLGVEIDPEARRVARENLQKNKLTESVEITDLEIEKIAASFGENSEQRFDVVVANIIDGVLVHLRDSLLKCMKPNAQLFLTGILAEREESFIQDFIEPSGLDVHRRIEKDEWVGYWLKSRDS